MYERDWFKWFSCKGKTESVRWEGRRNFWLCGFEYFLDWVLHHNTSVFRFWGQLRFSVSFYFDFRFSDCYSVFFRFLFGKCAPQLHTCLLWFCFRFQLWMKCISIVCFSIIFFKGFCGFGYAPIPPPLLLAASTLRCRPNLKFELW